jgi:hypothetical protein
MMASSAVFSMFFIVSASQVGGEHIGLMKKESTDAL